MAILRALKFSVLFTVFLPSVSILAVEKSPQGVFSKHMSDAILAGFQKGNSAPSVSTTAAPPDVEPEVVLLPAYRVADGPAAAKLDRDETTAKSQAIPLRWGTGVTEVKGRRFTVLTRKIFFIPIAWKIAW